MNNPLKGLIYDIRGFSVHDGPGIRKTVFLKGCPLHCSWCHNPESQNPMPQSWQREQLTGSYKVLKSEPLGRFFSVEEVWTHVRSDIPFYEESGGGITLSGGEPLMQHEFSFELLKKCRENDIHTCVDTCGYGPWKNLYKLATVTQLFLYDLKLANPQEHKRHTGKDNALVIENLFKLHEMGKELHIRIPLVQNITDTPSNLASLKSILERLNGLQRLDLLPFHNTADSKYQRLQLPNPLHGHENYPKEKAMHLLDYFRGCAAKVALGG